MTQEQEELIIELIEDDIRRHSVKTWPPTPAMQAWADGRVALAKESLAAFRELKEDLDFANGKGCTFTG